MRPEGYAYPTGLNTGAGLTIEYLILSGGGGGSFNTVCGPGAGAGGILTGSAVIASGTNFTVTIGAGGAKSASNAFGENGTAGGASSAFGLTANVATYVTFSVGGTSGNGFAGGSTPGNGGGGGGGTTVAGSNGSGSNGGAGGTGTTSSISGSSVQYGGGGSGGSDTTPATAAVYGGGIGASNAANGVDATANRGGGGGGGRSGYFTGSYYASSNGGSGVVIARYIGPQAATGGTVTTSGAYTIHTFTGTGILSVNPAYAIN